MQQGSCGGRYGRFARCCHGCRVPADDDPKFFVGPFPLLSKYCDELIGDFAARGLCLLATCPTGRERLIDPRDADLHTRPPAPALRGLTELLQAYMTKANEGRAGQREKLRRPAMPRIAWMRPLPDLAGAGRERSHGT
jgi:hypothetical protein